jgi:hypothetical protein
MATSVVSKPSSAVVTRRAHAHSTAVMATMRRTAHHAPSVVVRRATHAHAHSSVVVVVVVVVGRALLVRLLNGVRCRVCGLRVATVVARAPEPPKEMT